MRHNTKQKMSPTALSLNKIAISQEIVNSGDYNSAEIILVKEGLPTKILMEHFYRLGNCFYSKKQNQAAEMAWKKSALLADQTQEAPPLGVNFATDSLKSCWQTISLVILVIISLYVLVFSLFDREPELFRLSTDFGSHFGSILASFYLIFALLFLT